jgi:hypothetical protein
VCHHVSTGLYIPTHTKFKGKMRSDNGSQKDKDLAWNIIITQHFTVYTWLAKSFMSHYIW